MDEALKRSDRVIVHVDLDAFYCQVEHVRLGIPTSVPLCVQQWQGLIAVNYAARAAGIKRHCNVTEARKLCPDVRFVHVATFADGDTTPQYHTEGISYQTHKVSLDPYRKASMKVMGIFERSCPKYQRASIDEAYLDLTDEVNSRIKTRLASSTTDMEEDAEPDVNWDGAGILVGDQISHSTGWRDLQLRVAAEISQEIRATVYKELQYTCSAGIAHNKTLAKLCSGLNKPNKQTIMRQTAVLPFMEKLPLSDIRNLGGKLGTEVEGALGVTTAGELWNYSVENLQAKFGASTGSWLYDICRGMCHDPVTETAIAKSMMAAKTLRPHVKSVAELSHWLEILSNELYNRLIDDNALNNRWPKVITFHIKRPSDASSHSRRTDLPPFHDLVATSIRDRCLALWNNSSDSSSASRWPIERIAVGVGGFEKLDAGVVSVKNFFKKVEPADKAAMLNTPALTTPVAESSPPPSRRKPPAKATNSLQDFFNAAPAPSAGVTTSPSPQKNRPPSSSSGGPLDAFFQTTPGNTTAIPNSSKPQKAEKQDEQPSLTPAPNPTSDSLFQCATCPPGSATFSDARELAEHADWHMAMALHNEERGPGAAAPPSSSSSSAGARSGSTGPARGKRKRGTTARDSSARKGQPPLEFGRRE